MLKVNDSRKNHAGGVRLSRKLSVSNIIWEKDKNNFNKFLVGLKKNNIDAVELALNCLWDEPTVIKESDINWLKKIIYEYELEISALHALTYTRADLNFFRDKESFNDACSYLLKYVDIADKLGVQHLVLGSPSLRVMHEKSYSDCQLLFHEFLDKFDNYSDSIFLNIEPLPENICEFINTISEAADYADEYQTKCIFERMAPKENKEEFSKFYKLIKNKEYTTAMLQEFLFFNRKCSDIFQKMNEFNEIIEKNKPGHFEKKKDNLYM